jgi:siroheme synthase-like protein
MQTYPIMLLLAGRRVVLVGSGRVAQRKLDELLTCGAAVTVIAPALGEAFDREGVTRIATPYAASCLPGATLVFACTDDAALNARVVDDARELGVLACAVDQPADCDFFSPAVARDGEVIVAVGTGGSAPGLAGRLRDELAGAMPRQIGAFAEALATCRATIRARIPDPTRRKHILTTLTGKAMYEQFLATGPDAMQAALQALLAEDA